MYQHPDTEVADEVGRRIVYRSDRPPLHTAALARYETMLDPISMNEIHPSFRRRTREFFSICRKILAQEPQVPEFVVLPWGQTVGEFCIEYIRTIHNKKSRTGPE